MRAKVSEQSAKTTNPGILQVRRFLDGGGLFAGDMIYDQAVLGPCDANGGSVIVDPHDMTRRKYIRPGAAFEDLLVPVFRGGKCVYECPPLHQVRQRVQQQLAKLHPGIRRFLNPHEYPVGLEQRLQQLKTDLILELRGRKGAAPA